MTAKFLVNNRPHWIESSYQRSIVADGGGNLVFVVTDGENCTVMTQEEVAKKLKEAKVEKRI